MWYHVAEPNSYLVVTGVGIEKVLIKKKVMHFHTRSTCTHADKASIRVSLPESLQDQHHTFDFSMGIQAMTVEKLQFALPAVFTIGPADNMEALEKYAVLLTGESDGRPPAAASKGAITSGRNHVPEIVKGIIEGETRSIGRRICTKCM
jgi:flotillin